MSIIFAVGVGFLWGVTVLLILKILGVEDGDDD